MQNFAECFAGKGKFCDRKRLRGQLEIRERRVRHIYIELCTCIEQFLIFL